MSAPIRSLFTSSFGALLLTPLVPRELSTAGSDSTSDSIGSPQACDAQHDQGSPGQ